MARSMIDDEGGADMTDGGELIERARNGRGLDREEALALFSGIKVGSREMYMAMQAADQMSRRQFGNVDAVLAQIGVDWSPCPADCGFCAFAAGSGIVKEPFRLSVEETVDMAKGLAAEGVMGLSIMATAAYPFDMVLEIGRAVRDAVGEKVVLVANIGDMDRSQASALAEAGFTAIYHCIRLGEGRDTGLEPSRRADTIRAAPDAGMMVFACIEPIGPEHTPAEMVDLVCQHLDLGVYALATMRRYAVPGTPLASKGTISEAELARITSMIRLMVGYRTLSFGNHESSTLPLMSGANTITAEIWANPRKGELTRTAGATVTEARRKLWEAGWSTP
jgi:biotin synthase